MEKYMAEVVIIDPNKPAYIQIHRDFFGKDEEEIVEKARYFANGVQKKNPEKQVTFRFYAITPIAMPKELTDHLLDY